MSESKTTAIVFGYHQVGVRCLETLLAAGVDVKLVVTHEDDLDEEIWFDSVEEVAGLYGIPVVKPKYPNAQTLLAQVKDIAPDFIFSFYFRRMIPMNVLECAKRGAYNMHGSLLPRYRGRVPINWAIINGETETGATLHEMVEKPDAGRIAGQLAVPILPNDNAFDVFNKVTVAAELVLHRALPSLIDGTATLTPQDLTQGSYFGGRKPEDGLIDLRWPGKRIHDFVRALAPPYPGAFFGLDRKAIVLVFNTWRTGEVDPDRAPGTMFDDGEQTFLVAGDHEVLELLDFEIEEIERPHPAPQRRKRKGN